MAQAKKGKGKSKKPEGPSKADLQALAEATTPLEAVGPGTEHEDHEGGITDSLAKKGVRAALPTAEEREEAAEEDAKAGIIRAPSVRERQTGMSAFITRGGAVNPPRASAEELATKGFTPPPRGAHQTLLARDGSREVAVVARRLGQYPADGRLRAPGEGFIYCMTADEDKLPSWVEDPTGEIESRAEGEKSPAFAAGPRAVIEVGREGEVSVRAATASEVGEARTATSRARATAAR